MLQAAGDIYTIMPYCGGGDLFSVLKSCPVMNESMSKVIFRDVLAGISHVHALGVCHRYAKQVIMAVVCEGLSPTCRLAVLCDSTFKNAEEKLCNQ